MQTISKDHIVRTFDEGRDKDRCFITMQHLDGEEMVRFMGWANAIVTFDPDAPSLLSKADVFSEIRVARPAVGAGATGLAQ